MLLKVSENRYINRFDISEVFIEEKYVWFRDRNRRTIASMGFNSEEEAKEYCDELSSDIIADAIGLVAEKVENIGYDLGDLLEEMKKIRQVLGA